MSRSRTIAGLPMLDVALALGLLAVAEVSTLTAAIPVNGRALDAVSAALLTLPLALRRVRPMASAVAIGGALLVQSLVAEPLEAVWVIISVLLSCFSVAESAPLRPALAAAALIGLALGVSILNDPSDEAANIPPTLLLFVAIPFAAGTALGRREQHARVAEAEGHDRARDAVLAERARIARELHDVVAHSISVIAIQADAADAALRYAPDRAHEPVAVIRRTAVDALVEMQRLLGILREPGDDQAIAPQPGISDLGALVADARASGLRVTLAQTGDPRAVPSGIDVCAYRVVQEALTNVRKHSASSAVRVSVGFEPAALSVAVCDDARGGGSGGGAGLGLIGLRERVELFGGSLEAGPCAGDWRVAATLPLAAVNGPGI